MIEWKKETTENATHPTYVGIIGNNAVVKLFKTVRTGDDWLVSSWSIGFSSIKLESKELEDAQKEAVKVAARQLKTHLDESMKMLEVILKTIEHEN